MINNQKKSVLTQQYQSNSSTKKRKTYKKIQSVQLNKLKLNQTSKCKQDYIQSITKKFNYDRKKSFDNNQQLQKYKKHSNILFKKTSTGHNTLNNTFDFQQAQKNIQQSINNLKCLRKKVLQNAILQTQQYYQKLSPQKDLLFNSIQKNDLNKRKRQNFNSMLKKCQRQKEINKFENDLIFHKKIQDSLPVRIATQPIFPREHLNISIIKPSKIFKNQLSKVSSQISSQVSSPNKNNKQLQFDLNTTLQKFKYSNCINIEKAINMQKLKRQKDNASKSKHNDTILIIKQLKKNFMKQKARQKQQEKNYHTPQYITPWVQDNQYDQKYLQDK